MQQFKLHITGPYESKTITVEDELSIGRTNLATIALDDAGLSRVNTTFFIDDGELLVTDENSTNGTFLNGDRVEGRPRVLRDGDQLKVGTHTSIRVEISGRASVSAVPATETASPVQQASAARLPSSPSLPKPKKAAKAGSNTQVYLIAASAAMCFQYSSR